MATPGQMRNNYDIAHIEARNRSRGQATLPFAARDGRPAKFSTYRTIGAAWQEWMHGIGGNKPVKDWTPAEYRAQKSTMCRRDKLFQLMAKLVNAGIAPAVVITRIEQQYGPVKSIHAVNSRIRDDVKNGTLPPALRIN